LTTALSQGGPSVVTRRVSRGLLIGMELVVGANAVYGGIGLMVNGLGMPKEWLARTPFDSWLLPGIFLLLIVAVPMLAAAVAELARSPLAHLGSLAAGIMQICWIGAQVLILQRYFFLQPVLLAAGVVVTALAWWSHRVSRPSPASSSVKGLNPRSGLRSRVLPRRVR
jgi:sterol desaturase/sphingolipid hydroxylase (fatty acid hydroxylase superfamily)